MKTMTCTQLGGACEETFSAETFEEMAELSRNHGMENMQDPAHMKAMDDMRELMTDPNAMQEWMAARKADFDATEDDAE